MKTVAVTVPQFFYQDGSRDVINYANELQHKRAQLDLYEKTLAKFHQHWPSSFGSRLYIDKYTNTHRHTDRHAHRQPGYFTDPNDPNTFSKWKWLNVKTVINARLINLSNIWSAPSFFILFYSLFYITSYNSYHIWSTVSKKFRTSDNILSLKASNKSS